MTKRRILLKIEIFVLIFAAILGSVTFVMRNKEACKNIIPFYDEPKSSLDVIFLGTSHVINAINPMQLYNSYGTVSYNYAIHGEQFLQAYESLQEVLKYQDSQLIIIDLFALPLKVPEWKNTRIPSHRVFDNISFSFNKLNLISNFLEGYSTNINMVEIDTFNNKWELIFPIYYYHSNWNELKKNNFLNHKPLTKGHEPKRKIEIRKPPQFSTNRKSISKLEIGNIDAFYKIIDLCKKNNIKLLFTLIPYTSQRDDNFLYLECFNEIEYLLKKTPNVKYLNLFHNLDEIGFDFSTDLADFGHVNPNGAQKITTHIGKYIKEHYDIPDRRLDPAYAKWNDDYKLYVQDTFAQELNATKNSEKYLELLTNKKEATNNTCIFVVKISEKNINSKYFNYLGINVNTNNCITIIDEGKIVYNRTASDILLQHEYKIGRLPIKLVSDVKGKNSSIKVDGIEQIKNKSGITVVIYDKLLKKVSSVRSL